MYILELLYYSLVILLRHTQGMYSHTYVDVVFITIVTQH